LLKASLILLLILEVRMKLEFKSEQARTLQSVKIILVELMTIIDLSKVISLLLASYREEKLKRILFR
jgi:hypothetical protein